MTVILQWILSYVRMTGNEWTDKLTRKETEILNLSIKRVIKNAMGKNYDIKFLEKIKKKK